MRETERDYIRLCIYVYIYIYIWYVLAAILIVYDVIVIPLAALDIEKTGASDFLRAVEWIVTLYWTFDVSVSFRTLNVK